MATISTELNDALRSERTWPEVSSGLGKVLLGYAVFVAGLMVAGACLAGALDPMIRKKPLKLEHLWMFYAGLGLLKVIGLVSWGMVIGGQFRCLMNSTERHGAKWVIFFCLTCVVMGPVLHYSAWLGGLATPIRWNLGPEGFQKVRFSMLGLYLLLASLISSGLYVLSFWFYLFTITLCLRAPRAAIAVGMFVVLLAGAAGGTAFLALGRPSDITLRMLAPSVALGWVLVVLYWVLMIVVVKRTIDTTVELVRNPMTAYDATPRYEPATL